ncbi:thrombospondin type 3 repeat-containing protein [Tenacibaculum soleae]|uniref:thrombospondin type 3 repeat-containing protein n=1 Tax=Tenacibaculum soleae TaxID=447689 RepID=UPI0026E1204F|nr:thrombospondin type 3 repeat-containing protein [Tenacibaculum soleae]MDO6811641.1 thrombospondin type 3 repeat-containing protein [Tenacibaculum soleae]
MNKRRLFFGFFTLLAIGIVVLKSTNSQGIDIDKLRNQHAEFLKNHPFQKTGKLPKKQRKAQGLPPNAYFEQKYLSEINPSTGKTHKENVLALQKKLNDLRASRRAPGEVDNNWVERGPNNVGGRTRALLFDPNDATNETVFAGGVSGGLWKNTNISNRNSAWVRVGIPENLAVSCIAVDPNNSKIFYIGTGESYVNGDVNGDGLWKSVDGGNTWDNVFGGITSASYLDTNSRLTINTPSSISGNYATVLTTEFGGGLSIDITKELVLVNDGTNPTEDGCETITNGSELAGKIAVILRGTCNFSAKAKNAQDAGAIAVIIVNNQNTAPFNMAAGDNGAEVTIPTVMIGKRDGDDLINVLKSGTVTGTLSATNTNSSNLTFVPGVQHINDIVVRNNNGNSEVYVAAGESAYTGATSLGGDSYGVYKSVDGINFSKLNIPKTAAGYEHEPNNIKIAADNSLYISTTRSDTNGDGGGVIFKSTDGITFSKVYTITNGVRTEIAVSPTNKNTVYVLIEMNTSGAPVKMFKTTDNFANIAELPLPNDADTDIEANDFTRGQAFYDLLLRVDPNNEDVLYVGGIDLFKSTDGGATWNQLSHWYGGFGYQDVHADQHGLAFASSSKMVFGNDGGVYYSNNSGTNILPRNKNYNTLQFYTVGVAPTAVFGGKEYFIAGAQDNGTQLIEEALQGVNSSITASGGDGAASFFDIDGSDEYFITNYVYNQSILLYNYKTNQSIEINEENSSNGDFINQEELDSNLNILYSNYSNNSGFIVKRYSNLLETIIKVDLTNSLMDNAPSALKISPYTTTSSKLFLGLKNGKLLRVENANVGAGTWTEITGSNFIGSVSDIEFGKNEDEIFVTMHNYGVVSIWYSNDAGVSWISKEGDLPDLPVKTIMQNPYNENEVIIGTDLGIWKTSNFDAVTPTWKQAYNGMSNVPVLDLNLRDDNVVFAATYGRGVFSGSFLNPNEDEDNDGINNDVDNCPTTANPDQADVDDNGIGDVCQDTDGDGILDINDNCVNKINPNQEDVNNNSIGDACEDIDNDGVADNIDNCVNTPNADQKDINNDGIGDVCQDSDADGILDDVDNCPTTANPNQTDADNNGIGDACEDADNDGIIDTVDNCINTANPNQEDADNNGIGDACQDSDNDGVMDAVDNCPNTSNPDQADVNNNQIGDVCDTSYLDEKNISIQTTSETCVNENDGKVTVNVNETFVSYTLTLIGNTTNETIQLTSASYTFENLAPGNYEVCVVVDDKNYKQCFEIKVKPASTVSLRLAKNNQSKNYTVNVSSGTAPYKVFLNGDLVNTFNQSTFNVKVKGKGLIEVTTAKACEGKFTTTIDNVFLRSNPVIESIELLVPLETPIKIKATVFDITGKVVLNENIERQGNELSIPFSNYKSGIYILKLGNDKNNTFKILKK